MAKKELSLKVAEAIQDDVNKGIVRIDSTALQEMGVKPGSVIEIEGNRKTVAIADRAYPGDIGLSIIRMDGIIRKNCKTGIGEIVKTRQIEAKEAKKVIIAPARKDIMIKASPQVFKHGLLGRALVKGDIVSLGGTKRRRTATSNNPLFEDMFSSLLDDSFGFGTFGGFGDLKFIVVETSPKQAVIITDQTEIVFNPEAVDIKDDFVPEVSYEDIGGLDDELKKVREMVEIPLKHPEIFERLGIEPPKGVLLHGPPGTGKTLLAKAVANETNSHFILINGPEIMSKFYGQSEENIRKKFEEAEKNAPSIIFIDEIDAIASKREETKGEVERRVVAQLLALMDGLKSRGKVVVIAATNVPNILDPALRRPGRFDREIEIGVPGKKGRLEVLKIHTRNMPLDGRFYTDIFKEKILKHIKDMDSANLKELDDLNAKLKESKAESGKEEISSHKLIDKTSNLNEKITSLEKKIRDLQQLKFSLEKNSDVLLKIADKLKQLDDNKEPYSIKEIKAKLTEAFQADKEKEILSKLINQNIISEDFIRRVKEEGVERDLSELAKITHGFVGADLASLAKESAMIVLRKVLPEITLKEDEPIPKEVLEKLKIAFEDFTEALKVVRPSALREVLIEKPNVTWEDIGGLGDVKQELIEAVEWPLKHPDSFIRLGVKPPKGVLLYGAPGTGKTLMAKAVAKEAQANFISIKGPELLSKWVGESEKAVREIFKKARQASPSIIFFDEIDSLAPRRGLSSSESHTSERVVNQLLTEIDGLEEMHDVVILAATNRPDIVDTALLRPGRFDRIILTPAPDEKSRLEIFKVHTRGMPLKDVSIEELAKETEGYVGADIESVCREAAILALRENIKAKDITLKHFKEALNKVRPSVNKEIEETYKELKEHFSSAKANQMKEERPAYYG